MNKSVFDDIETVRQNILRRQRELDDDLSSNILIENRIISNKLNAIPGMKSHLSKAKQSKLLYENQEVIDNW
jgi:hypothetical protein